MTQTRTRALRARLVGGAVLAASSAVLVLAAAAPPQQAQAQPEPPPKILYETSPRAIEYQVGRLTNAELMRIDRRDDDVKFRPVYLVMLTRKGLGREYFDEALAALVRMDKATPSRVLLAALGRVAPDDGETADKIISILAAQPADTLRKDRSAVVQQLEATTSDHVRRGAFAVLLAADPSPDQAWQLATGGGASMIALLKSVASLPAKAPARTALFERIAGLLKQTPEPAVRNAAISAIPHTRSDEAAFRLLAAEVIGGPPEGRRTAIAALRRIPASSFPPADVEPVARAVLSVLSGDKPQQRTTPTGLDEIAVGERLIDALSGETARALRRDLRALGVQVIRIETIPEQMSFDLRWFAVEAGKPVQIVLSNPDAMPHNLLLTKPGALKEVGTAASTMSLPSDPSAKPYVPDSPLVLQATRLLNWGETERLGFAAPKEPGEYPFVCTFPGHWVRMYGVMLVVESLDAWEAKRTVPTDPMTGQPFAAQR